MLCIQTKAHATQNGVAEAFDHYNKEKKENEKPTMEFLFICAGSGDLIWLCSRAGRNSVAPTAAPTVPSSTATAAINIPVTSGQDPIQVVQAYVAAAESGDLQKALAYFAEDAVVKNGLGLFVGRQQIGGWLENDVKSTRSTPTGWKVQGPLVVTTGQVTLARFKQAGINSVAYRAEYMVDPSGKIRFFAPVVTLTPDQQQKLKAAQANAAPALTPEQNPLDVVKAYVAAANMGNLDQALAFYSDDSAALVINGTQLLSGKSQIANWLKSDVQTTRATPQDWQVNGSTVTNTGTVTLDRFKKLGIDSVQYSAEYVVEKGKIRYFRPTVSLTPEQQAIVQASQPASKP